MSVFFKYTYTHLYTGGHQELKMHLCNLVRTAPSHLPAILILLNAESAKYIKDTAHCTRLWLYVSVSACVHVYLSVHLCLNVWASERAN